MATTLVARPATRIRRMDDVFFVTMSALVLAAVVFGFAESYYLRGAVFARLPSVLVHVHGAAFSLWIVLFVVQTVLVAKRRVGLHRTLGTVGGFLAAAMVVLGWTATIALVRRGTPLPAGFTAPTFLILNNLGITVFGVLTGWAIYVRNRPAEHKRLILLGTLGLTGPAISRWPVDFIQKNPAHVGIFFFAYVVSVMLYDVLTRHKPYRVTVVGTVMVLAVQPIAVAASHAPLVQRLVAELQHSSSRL